MFYLIVLFIHITGALLLFAAIGIEWLCFIGLRNSTTFERANSWIKSFSIISRLYPISFITILASGIYMMAVVWEMVPWIIVAFLSMILMAVLGGVLTGKKMKPIEKRLAESNSDERLSVEIREELNSAQLWNSIQLRTAIGLGIIFLMAVKPALLGSILTILIAVIIGFVPIFSKGKNISVEKFEKAKSL